MRFDGSEERFTAYYRPSYWTEDDSSVFLGEYPTYEEAADAHNLVALLHEGGDAQIILPYTADRYTNELRRWEGKHHVDLVCELRLRQVLKFQLINESLSRISVFLRVWHLSNQLNQMCNMVSRGRGLLKDGSVNYKHVGRRWSGKKKGTRYFSTVSDDPVSSSNAKRTSKTKFLSTFETPEQAAQYADEVLVKRRGNEAWTNFPLSSYIELPLTFLPISNNFRDNLTYKRTKPDVAFS
ncbi:hypothetical protein M758_2G090800 [Ceratodon purpureus]|nr:hypothetical protein M758_2G090800 [Ceratodon purpureus]